MKDQEAPMETARQMVWERSLAGQTDHKRFGQYIDWRKTESQRLFSCTPERDSFVRRLLSRLKLVESKADFISSSCGCTFSRSIAMQMQGVAFYVCSEHANQYGINIGPYYEEEVLALLIKGRKL